MTRSMYSAISGMRAHQTWMDTIGNNIANVNTTAYKESRVRFQDILSQTIQGAGSPAEGRAGVNPEQIGLGTMVGAIDNIQTQGSLHSTGRNTDFAIQGDGFFVVTDGNQNLFTRDGAFDIGVDGRLVNSSTGMYVLGWPADATGNVDTTQPLTPIMIPIGQRLDAEPTSQVVVQGNLNAASATDGSYSYDSQLLVVDPLGFTHQLKITYTRTGTSTWDWTVSGDTTADPALGTVTGSGTIEFDEQGKVKTTPPTGDLTVSFTNGAGDLTLTGGIDFSQLTQLASVSSANAAGNGSVAGALISFTTSQNGEILGLYSNGTSKKLGQLATAIFANPGGLSRAGDNLFTPTASSGQSIIGTPGAQGHGTVHGGYLEMSNVDLAEQFTDMIMAERGFQANSRVITTTDEMLQDLTNLKR